MTDRVSLQRSHHPGGMPVIDGVTLAIGSVSITLNEADYQALCATIDEQLGEQRRELQVAYERYWKEKTEYHNMLDELRGVFYADEDEDFAFLRELEEIDRERLHEVLDRHARLTGLG